MIYVLDEEEGLSAQVASVVSDLRPHPGVTWCDGFESLHESTRNAGPTDVLIAGPLAFKEAGFQELRTLRMRLPGMTVVLAVDKWRSTSLRDTVRTGALDILRLPVADAELLEAIQQALEVGRSQSAGAQEPDPVASGDARPDGRGAVLAVVSATGGCGKTFFATSLAYYLQSRPGTRTCVIDLDLQFGELSTALRLKPKYTIVDLLSQELEEDLSRRFVEHLSVHECGVSVLAAPEDPAEADGIDAADVTRVIEEARARFDYVIIDTPAALSDAVLVAVEMADQLFALATLDLPSVRNLGLLLATLKKLKVPAERIHLLLNKVEPDVGIDVARVTEYFPQGFSMVVPYGREVNRSLNMGQPLLAYAPRGDVGKALGSGLGRVIDVAGRTGGEVAPLPRRRRSLLGTWHARKTA
jgi:pilus assembly protein CpaE